MSFLSFQIASLFYIILIAIIYFSKDRIKNLDNSIYSWLIIINCVGVVLDIASTLLAFYDINNVFLKPLSKLYLVYIISWVLLFTIYIVSIAYSRMKLSSEQRWFIITIIIYFIFILSIFILPIYNHSSGESIYTHGPSVLLTYFFCGVCSLVWIISIILNRKNLKNKKYIPLLAFAICGLSMGMLQFFSPETLIITFIFVFINFLMYHTIENPDVQMIEQLNFAKDSAEKANRAKSDFLSSMSHEIRTPLNAIVGFSECIKTEESLEDAKKDAEDIIMASANLLEIVNGVLDISKIEANKMEIVDTDYKLLPNLENLAKLMIPRIGDRPIELKTYFAPDIPDEMYGDIGKIKQIITNLLTNAVKYTEQGEINFRVSCINENNICSLVVSVKDTGRGIKKDKIDSLFTKFNRLEEDRNTTIEGTGLGLAITKSLVEMMGGKIVVQSTYGVGSEFIVYLKQKIVKMHSEEEAREVKEEERITFNNAKVLVVDDNKLNIKLAEKLLKQYNINVTSLESGFDTIENIKAGNTYDLILLDDMMPKMRGTETLAKLKEISGFNIPTIALTANALAGMKESYLKQGFNDYLAKPIDKHELNNLLKKYLGDNKENVVTEKVNAENEIIENKSEIVEKESLEERVYDASVDSKEEVAIEQVEEKESSTEEVQKRVLVVDDNKLNIKVVTNFLKPYNLIIDSCLSGSEAIEKVKENKYDIIFMDDMMPELSGIETFKELQKMDNFHIPTIALTANAIEGSREKYLSEGFNDYLAKPIDKNELDRIINENITTKIESEQNQENKQDKENKQDYLKQNEVDIDKGIELLGDISTYNEMMLDFFNGLGDRLTSIKDNFKSENMEEYSIQVHALKSDSKYLGFTKLAEIAYNHELKSKEKDIEYIKEHYKELMNEASRIALVVKDYLEK